MRYRVGRFLQAISLFVIIPLAVAGNMAEVAAAEHALSLKESLLLAGAGMVIFYIGRMLQGPVQSS